MSVIGELDALTADPYLAVGPLAPLMDPTGGGTDMLVQAGALPQPDDAALAGDPSIPPKPTSPTPTANAPAGAPVNVGGGGMSVSTERLNEQTLETLTEGKPAKGLQGKKDRAQNERVAEGQALAAHEGAAYDDKAAAAAESARVAADVAADKSGDAEKARPYIDKMANLTGLAGVDTTGAAQLATAQASVAAKQAELQMQAQQKAEAARAQYQEHLARVQALRVEPHRLFANQPLAFGLQNATAMVAAVTGRPGMQQFAKMLHGSIFESIDRDIRSQISNIKNQQNVADGFKQIWDMVGAENDDAQTAYTKMSGAYLAAMESYVQSEMGKHDSAIINAQLGETLAQLRHERAKMETQHYVDAVDRAQKDAALLSQEHQNAVNASVQRERIAFEKDKLAFEKDVEKAKAEGKLVETVNARAVVNPFSKDGEVIAFGRSDDATKTLQGAGSAVGYAIPALETLYELNKKLNQEKSVGNFLGVKALESEIAHQAKVVQGMLVTSIAKTLDPDSKGVTDQEQANAKAMALLDPGLWLSAPDKALGEAQRQLKRRWDATTGQLAVDINNLSPEVRSQIYRGYVGNANGAGEAVDQSINLKIEGEAPNVVKRQRRKEDITGPDANDVETKFAEQTPEWFKRYVADNPSANAEYKYTTDDVPVGGFGNVRIPGVSGQSYNVPDYGQEIVNLAEAAANGDAEARLILEDVAKMTDFPQQAEMARYFLENPPNDDEANTYGAAARKGIKRATGGK